MYTVHCNHIHPHFPPPTPLQKPSNHPPPNFTSFYLCMFPAAGSPRVATPSKENDSSFPSNNGVGPLEFPYPPHTHTLPHLHPCWNSDWLDLVHVICTNCDLFQRQHFIYVAPLHLSAFRIFLPPLPQCSLCFGERLIKMSPQGPALIHFLSALFLARSLHSTLWSLQKETSLSKAESGSALGNKQKYLEGNLTSPFIKIAIVGLLPPRAYGIPSHRLLIRLYNSRPLSVEQTQIQSETSWLPHNMHITIIPVSTSCLAGWYCSIQGLAFSKTIVVLSPSVVCIESSGTRKVSQQ